MTIIGSCGHELNNVTGNPIITTDKTREGEICLSYGNVCDKCYEWYKQKRLIIKNVKLWERRHWGIK
jgi:hypothetical protein